MAEEPPPSGDILPNYPYRTKEAAALLQIHPKTLLERRSAGLIRGYREGRTWRFRGQWLIDYMEHQVPE